VIHQRDGIILPTFINDTKVLSMSILPSKTKKAVFQVFNRTKWTKNTALKSGMVPDARCLRCVEVETMVLNITQPKYGDLQVSQ
jgi:hypothetical protein